MGEIVKMVCHGCGHGWQCRTGCGAIHAKLDSVIGCFDEEKQKSIQSQMKGKKFPLFSFGYQPAYCVRCHDIVSVPVLELIKEQISYVGECPKCSSEIKSGQIKGKVICPICQGSEFDVHREGFWD